ncbi:MAG: undecaprenyl-phosphate glucose phosphotransferase [Lachnospiraceae bacterium]|nr:undecaprenyl-phosphate glucose phosphotransferase [Lachnospiraceae bacterium]
MNEHRRYYNYMMTFLDALIITGSYIFAWWLRIKSPLFPPSPWTLARHIYMRELMVIVPGFLVFYYLFHVYSQQKIQRKRTIFIHLLQANAVAMMAEILFLYLRKENNFARTLLFLFVVFTFVLEVSMRMLFSMIEARLRATGSNMHYVILAGYSKSAEQYIDRIIGNPGFGIRVRGILDDREKRGMEYRGVKVIGMLDDLDLILKANSVDEIVITLDLQHYQDLGKIVSMCEKSGVHTKFVPDYGEIISSRPYTEDMLGLPVINIRHVPLMESMNRNFKRIFDLIGGAVCIVIFSPVMLVTALLIKLTSKGPIIYTQERIGYQNRPFKMLKFRSMVVQEASAEVKKWTTKDDPRVTKIGKFIRKTSIDELPQLFNVMKGQMSLVGPRPERPFFVEKFREEIPRYMIKHQVRPGMTGWAQVNGLRGDTSITKRIEYDLYYIENWTLGFDIKIMIFTVFRGFVNKNAY